MDEEHPLCAASGPWGALPWLMAGENKRRTRNKSLGMRREDFQDGREVSMFLCQKRESMMYLLAFRATLPNMVPTSHTQLFNIYT